LVKTKGLLQNLAPLANITVEDLVSFKVRQVEA